MKTYGLVITIFILTCNNLFAEIKNGYEKEIHGVRASLRSLREMLESNKTLSIFQKGEINSKIQTLKKFISYYELTENLLQQFRTIAPDLYNETDTIKDKKGRVVDVYVKFIPEMEMQNGISGTTNIAQHENDKDAYLSEYGAHTVSVKISTVKKALLLLAHEFGHINYQVPHLASYIEFHAEFYQDRVVNSKQKGHNSNDPGGQAAREYEYRFRQHYLTFLKTTYNKFGSPMALIQEISKDL